jgi:hypothetical protein
MRVILPEPIYNAVPYTTATCSVLFVALDSLGMFMVSAVYSIAVYLMRSG